MGVLTPPPPPPPPPPRAQPVPCKGARAVETEQFDHCVTFARTNTNQFAGMSSVQK